MEGVKHKYRCCPKSIEKSWAEHLQLPVAENASQRNHKGQHRKVSLLMWAQILNVTEMKE